MTNPGEVDGPHGKDASGRTDGLRDPQAKSIAVRIPVINRRRSVIDLRPPPEWPSRTVPPDGSMKANRSVKSRTTVKEGRPAVKAAMKAWPTVETHSTVETLAAKSTLRERGSAGTKQQSHAERREKNKTMAHFNLPPVDR